MIRPLLLVVLLLATHPAFSRAPRPVVWSDPAGDDNGPGDYTYPTDAVYAPGTFDLTEVSLQTRGKVVDIRVRFASPIQDPWDSRSWEGRGFSLQQVHLYMDTDIRNEDGHRDTLPGTGAVFGPERGWERLVILSPQSVKQARATLSEAQSEWTDRVIIPRKLRVKGDTLIATVSRRALGGRPSSRWALQALVFGMDAFADPGTMGIREVNQLPGAHRFGGGTDSDCDPNIVDLVAATAEGQGKALGVVCAWEDGGPVPAALSLVSP